MATKNRKSGGKSKTSKNTNPLFVVTNKGQVVEEAKGLWDALIKKYSLAPYVEILQSIWQELLKQIQSYAVLESVTAYLKSWMEELSQWLKKAHDLGRPYLKSAI